MDRPQCADRQHAASLHDHRAGEGADRSRSRNCRWCAIPSRMPICARRPMAFWSVPTKPPRAHVCWDGAAAGLGFRKRTGRAGTGSPDALARNAPPSASRCLRKAGLKSVISGAITHTPDGVYLSGPAPGAAELLDALRRLDRHLPGRRRRQIPGAMDGARPGRDQHARIRSAPLRQLGEQGLSPPKSSVADYQHMYYCYKPAEQHEVGRDLRHSSLHEKLKARGAQFSQVFGWERARWYDPTGKGEQSIPSSAPTGGTRCARNAWRCASASG